MFYCKFAVEIINLITFIFVGLFKQIPKRRIQVRNRYVHFCSFFFFLCLLLSFYTLASKNVHAHMWLIKWLEMLTCQISIAVLIMFCHKFYDICPFSIEFSFSSESFAQMLFIRNKNCNSAIQNASIFMTITITFTCFM